LKTAGQISVPLYVLL